MQLKALKNLPEPHPTVNKKELLRSNRFSLTLGFQYSNTLSNLFPLEIRTGIEDSAQENQKLYRS